MPFKGYPILFFITYLSRELGEKAYLCVRNVRKIKNTGLFKPYAWKHRLCKSRQQRRRMLIRSVDGDQFIVRQVVSDRMSKGDYLAIIDCSGIDTSSLELVDECLVVVGTHTCPTAITNLTVEDVY